MNPKRHVRGRPGIVVFLCGLLAACTVAGPAAIRNGRMTYNQAINETSNQQMLMAVIHNRYEETSNLLAVSSVTANVRVRASTSIQLGVGDRDNYEGNLVPLTVGGIYEENPTISYVPVAGAQYATQIFSPVPLSVMARLTGSLVDPGYVYTALISRVNGIQNHDFLLSPTTADARFERFVSVITKLTRANCLQWAADPEKTDRFFLVIDHYAQAYRADVKEFHAVLGLAESGVDGSRVIVPVFQGLDDPDSDGISMTTRSVGDLVEILSASVEVPPEDDHNGVVAEFPSPGLVGQKLRILFSESRPGSASVSVPYRGGWFYIDETDQATKRFFRLLSSLWSVTIAESASRSRGTPVLTVPVSR
jgi:hypothetical protein